jgi:tight adherence protein B
MIGAASRRRVQLLCSEPTMAPIGSSARTVVTWQVHAVGMVLAAFLGVVGRLPIAVTMPVIVALARHIRRRSRQRAMRSAEEAAVVELVDHIGLELRAGGSLNGSIRRSLDAVVDPGLASRIQSCRRALLAGERLDAALGRMDERGLVPLGLLATSLVVLIRQGGPPAVAVDRLGDALRVGLADRADARATASQATASALVLSCLPVVFGLGAAVIEPATAELYLHSWIGAACVIAATVLAGSGWVWIDRLVER